MTDTVWVVVSIYRPPYQGDDRGVIAVCATEEIAEAWVKDRESRRARFTSFEIESYGLETKPPRPVAPLLETPAIPSGNGGEP